MRDRQKFKKYKLKNGIVVHYYDKEYPFNVVHLKIPVGTANNTGKILPGLAHFLEHSLFMRSKKHPERYEFDKIVGLKGGYHNAYTGYFRTVYEMELPKKDFLPCFEGFLSQVFEPIFVEEDLISERTVVGNERKGNRWFPGDTEIENHALLKWMNFNPCPSRQVFGLDNDLNKMKPEVLEGLHKVYFSKGIEVMIGGKTEIGKICKMLESIRLKPQKLKESYKPIGWKNKKFHTKAFNDAGYHIFHQGAIFKKLPSYQDEIAIRFIGEFLTNFNHGPLYKWLRHELGWIYYTRFIVTRTKNDLVWFLEIPLHNKKQVDTVRKEIRKKILEGLSDKKWVDKEVKRRLGSEVFLYQTLRQILRWGMEDLENRRKIVSEKEFRGYVKKCGDTNYLLRVFDKYFNPKNVGEFCAIPKKK